MVNRILVVGLGSIGKRHFAILNKLVPNAEFRFLRHTESKDQAKYSPPNLISIEQAASFRPHLSVIANPASMHIETAEKLANTGSNLFIEKPMSTNSIGLQSLVDLCARQKLILAVGYNLRYLPSLMIFRKLILEGVIGDVLSVRVETGSYLPEWRPEADYVDTVSAKKELGGGALLELSHDIDYVRWIFGEVAWVRASLMRQSSLEINVEDSVHLVLGFEPNSFGYSLTGQLNLDFIRRDRQRNCTAIGKSGTLKWDAINNLIMHYDPINLEWNTISTPEFSIDQSYVAQWKDVLRSINTGIAPMVSGEDGIAVMRVVDAVRLSAPTGQQVLISNSALKS